MIFPHLFFACGIYADLFVAVIYGLAFIFAGSFVLCGDEFILFGFEAVVLFF